MAINFKSEISLGNNKLTNLGNPTLDTDAANKSYVDSVATGLDIKNSVRVGTTANLVATRAANILTADANGALVIDGVTMAVNDRVLVKNQTNGEDNGIYFVSAIGDGSNPYTLTRTSDADNSPSGEVTSGMFTFVTEGTTNADSGWTLVTEDPIVLNTTILSFTQFSGAGQITAGDALSKTGNTLNVNVDNSSIEVNADALRVKLTGINETHLHTSVAGDGIQGGAGNALSIQHDGEGLDTSSGALAIELDGTTLQKSSNGLKVNINAFPQRYTVTPNTSSTSYTITHSLNTLYPIVQLYEVSTGDMFFTDISVTDANTVTLTFANSQSANSFRVSVLG